MIDNTVLAIFEKHSLPFRHMISYSKSGYRKRNPEHLVIFNARIYSWAYFLKERKGAIKDFFAGQKHEFWYGDLDLNLHINKIHTIARELGTTLVVTTESGTPIIVVIGDSFSEKSLWEKMFGK